MAISYQDHLKSHMLLHFIFIINLVLIMFSPMTHSIMSDEEALLEFKKSLTEPDALSSWIPNTSPCQDKNTHWNGVICFEGIVIGLRLKSMGLSGNIDVDALSNLPGLRSISLEGNMFSGPMPEFNRLGSLKAIYLSNNQFSGEISSNYFLNMGSLKKLWLDNNKFFGEIPLSLAQLRYLLELHLENNQFSGMVPPLKQPPLLSLDLSNNQLQGEIPMSLSKFNASSFEGNPNLCGDIVGRDCNQVMMASPMATMNKEANSDQVPNNKSNTKFVSISVTLSVVVLSLVTVVFFVSKKRKDVNIPTVTPILNPNSNPKPATSTTPGGSERKNTDKGVVEVAVGPTLSRKDSNNNSSSRKSSSSRRSSGKGGGDVTVVNDERGLFGLADLMKATAEVLGNGGMGSAYKALMANGLAVAVKRMRELNKLEEDAFDREMRKLASLRHDNVLPPLAYHYRKEEKLVVYEYVAKGSLYHLLHDDRGLSHAELNWPTRLKIIKGIAQGLRYLHSQLHTYDLPHGNLKSSNILINLQNEPLLSDYGFNTMTNPNIAANALFGYRSPEAIKHQIISPKCDVFCLGVVILEILTGKFPCQYLTSTKNGTDVVQWAVSAMGKGRESRLLDPDMGSTSTGCKASMVELLHIGLDCTEPNPYDRPCLDEVVERIESVEVEDNSAPGG